MKQVIWRLGVGDEVMGQVEELFSDGFMLISLEGDLLRVRNDAGIRFAKGDEVSLQVISRNPLSFRIVRQQLSSGLDVKI